MFREMRRKKQLLTQQECIDILDKGSCGVLSLLGEDGYPYGVPMSYVYSNGRLYFHCAKAGHKLDAVREYNKASFCVVAQDDVVPEKYTTIYRSVIAFGQIEELQAGPRPQEVQEAIELLCGKYCPDQTAEETSNEIASALGRLCILQMNIQHLTGKQAKELAIKPV